MNREVNPNHRTANHLCDPTRLRAETRRTQGHPVPRGGFHKAWEGPAFGGSLVTFCPVRKLPQRSVPGWQACIWKNRTTDYLSHPTEIVQFVSRETPIFLTLWWLKKSSQNGIIKLSSVYPLNEKRRLVSCQTPLPLLTKKAVSERPPPVSIWPRLWVNRATRCWC